MKILGFETNEGLRLGVVEGDNVIDLQAADARLPVNLADVLAETGGDLKPLADLAKKAPASARVPLQGLKFGLPVARPPKSICLGLNYLEHVKEGFSRDNVPFITPAGVAAGSERISQTVDAVTGRINWRFGWGNTVAARY